MRLCRLVQVAVRTEQCLVRWFQDQDHGPRSSARLAQAEQRSAQTGIALRFVLLDKRHFIRIDIHGTQATGAQTTSE